MNKERIPYYQSTNLKTEKNAIQQGNTRENFFMNQINTNIGNIYFLFVKIRGKSQDKFIICPDFRYF